MNLVFFKCENGHYLIFWENLWNIKNNINTVYDTFITCFDYYFILSLLKIILLDAHLLTDVKIKECNM